MRPPWMRRRFPPLHLRNSFHGYICYWRTGQRLRLPIPSEEYKGGDFKDSCGLVVCWAPQFLRDRWVKVGTYGSFSV